MKAIRLGAFCLILAPLFTSCLYQMPDEDHLHEIPTTNNPNITRDNNSGMALPV